MNTKTRSVLKWNMVHLLNSNKILFQFKLEEYQQFTLGQKSMFCLSCIQNFLDYPKSGKRWDQGTVLFCYSVMSCRKDQLLNSGEKHRLRVKTFSLQLNAGILWNAIVFKLSQILLKTNHTQINICVTEIMSNYFPL